MMEKLWKKITNHERMNEEKKFVNTKYQINLAKVNQVMEVFILKGKRLFSMEKSFSFFLYFLRKSFNEHGKSGQYFTWVPSILKYTLILFEEINAFGQQPCPDILTKIMIMIRLCALVLLGKCIFFKYYFFLFSTKDQFPDFVQ